MPIRSSMRAPAKLLITALFSTALLLGLTGCGGAYYPKTDHTARVRSYGEYKGLVYGNKIELMGVDREGVGTPMYQRQFQEVDAGKRELIVHYVGYRKYGGPNLETPPIPVLADFKENEDYELTGKFEEVAVGIWVKNIKTGKPAGPITVAPVKYVMPPPAPVTVPVYIPMQITH